MKQKIVYTIHPVSSQLKRQLIADGYKIIDAVFAGVGDKIFNKPEPKTKPKPKKSIAAK